MSRNGVASIPLRMRRSRFWGVIPAVFAACRFTRRRLAAVGVLGTAAAQLGCAPFGSQPPEHPSVTLPIDLAGGSEQPEFAASPLASPAEAGAHEPASPEALPGAKNVGPPLEAPDPKPLRSRVQYEFTLLYDQGTISVERIQKREHAEALVTPRRMGRWALELCVGRELIERYRFDFPLLAGEEPAPKRQPLNLPPRFAPGTRVSLTLSLPESERATFARLVDRQTREVTSLPWPPVPTGVAGKANSPTETAPGVSKPAAPAGRALPRSSPDAQLPVLGGRPSETRKAE